MTMVKCEKGRISVIVPAYNVEDCVGKAIESVVAQDYTNWELIIIDDGSKDNTKDVVKKYLKDKRIKYFFQKNRGVAGARNNGLKKAVGEYITLLDSDDEILPGFFKSAIKKFKLFEQEKLDIKTIYYPCIDELRNRLYSLPFEEALITFDQFLEFIGVYGKEYIFMKKRDFIDEGFFFDEDIDTPGVRHFREFKKYPLIYIINKPMRIFTQEYDGRTTMSVSEKRLKVEIKGKERFLKENGDLFLKYNKDYYFMMLKIIIFSSGLLGEYNKNLRSIIKMIRMNRRESIKYSILLLFSSLFGRYFYNLLYKIFAVAKRGNFSIKKKLLW